MRTLRKMQFAVLALALSFAAAIPNIAPGKENPFSVFYDVPTGTRPTALRFSAIGTTFVFAR